MRVGDTGNDLPVILLPGLNGDPGVFAPQAEAFPTLTIVRWVPPMPTESLAAYARRLAHSIDPQCPCLIGGVSFGGIVALEAARSLQARACFVIASSRDVGGLPAPIRLMRPVAKAASPGLLRSAVRSGWGSAAVAAPRFRCRAKRLSADEIVFRQWALRALLTWEPSASHVCPVLQIHGDHDTTFPASRTKAERLVPNAGHLLTITHARQVNEFIRAGVRRYGP